jgi:hypothetical protein
MEKTSQALNTTSAAELAQQVLQPQLLLLPAASRSASCQNCSC